MDKHSLRFGWKPDVPDHRDHLYSAPLKHLNKLPVKVDLRRHCPPVYNQGPIASCTANAIAAAVQFGRRKEGRAPDFVPSRLFIYYNERVIQHAVAFDAGAQIREGIKTVTRQGVCPETEWPYDDTPPLTPGGAFPPNDRAGQKPTAKCYKDATKYRAVDYQRVSQGLSQMKGCLAEGYPFVFGFSVYSSWMQPKAIPATVMPMPSGTDSLVGAHAVMAVGYDDATQQFAFRSSWGAKVGDKGYFYMPYAYLTDNSLSDDLWTIRVVED